MFPQMSVIDCQRQPRSPQGYGSGSQDHASALIQRFRENGLRALRSQCIAPSGYDLLATEVSSWQLADAS